MAPKQNSLKKIYRSEFLQSSFIFVMYLLNEVYRKIMSEIHFVGKTRYEDLTETGVEASNVINDPKCNKGPKCNTFWP